MPPLTRKLALIVILAGIVVSIGYLESQKARPQTAQGEPAICTTGEGGRCTTTNMLAVAPPGPSAQPASRAETATKALKYKKYNEITNPSGFLNTGGSPITISSLIGRKVILVDFWTYSCINCQRTLPYLTAWYEKYKDLGLEIVSIHTPEFEFEKDATNVMKAAERFGVKYPIVQDNDYGTWRAYHNSYWPRKYLIDIDGFIVYDHIGEGGYTETEKKIQELLTERSARLGQEKINVSGVTAVKAEEVDSSNPRTPEIYFGAFRNEALGNGKRLLEGVQIFTIPTETQRNLFYLDGSWNITREYARNTNANTRIILPYSAQKVFIVASAQNPIRVKVMLNGAVLPENMRGADVDADGFVTIKDNRLYRIIEAVTWGEHTLELIIESPNLDVYTFTFG